MRIRNILLIVAALSIFGLSSCKTDLDMRKADLDVDLSMGLALPVGSMRMTLGDIIGATPLSSNVFYDSIGTLLYKDTFDIHKPFHPVDITEKGTNTELKHFHMEDFYSRGLHDFNDVRARLTFDVAMKLNHVNDSLNYERFDSVLIKSAVFESMINYRTDDDGHHSMIEADWIEAIDMILGDQFTREDGNIITLYDRNRDPHIQYGQQFESTMDEFTMSLMRDKNLPNPCDSATRNANAIDSLHFQIRIQLHFPNTQLYFDDMSAFEYTMRIGMLQYRAVWGMFSPSNDMRDEGTFNIGESWEIWKTLKDLKLPFYEPEILLNCETEVAGQLMLEGEYLYVENETTNDRVYAEFDGKHSLKKVFPEEQCLSLLSPIGQRTTLKIRFSKDKSEGAIDRLFTIHPDIVGYQFQVDFADRAINPVARITDNTDVGIHAVLRAPLSFNEGLNAAYGDTIRDLDISVANPDSLRQRVEGLEDIKDARVILALVAANELPMDVRGVLKFMDENGEQIMVKQADGTLQPLRFSESDTIHISAPTLRPGTNGGEIEQAGNTDLMLEMNDEQLDAFSRTKSIVFDVYLNDDDIAALQHKNPEQNLYPIRVKTTSALRLKIGVAASIEGVMDLKKMLQK